MKKMIIASDDSANTKSGSAWVVPIPLSEGHRYVCLSDHMPTEYGTVVYTGRDVTAQSVVKKIVESGLQVSHSGVIEDFLKKIGVLKIGDLVALGFGKDGEPCLIKMARPTKTDSPQKLP